MPATATLPALLALYKIDRDLHQHQMALDNLLKDQKNQEAKIAQLSRDLENKDTTFKKLQADANTREMEIKTRQDHIEKMRGTLNTTKTNKEYSAILLLISAEKAEVSKMETALLEQMQELETTGKVNADIKTQIAGEQVVLQKMQAELADKVNTLKAQMATLQAKREGAAVHIPAEPLKQYNRISEKYPGDAMAPLEYEDDDLDGVSCGSCFMGLNVEHLNALRSRDEIRRCNSCNRILYLPDMMAQVS